MKFEKIGIALLVFVLAGILIFAQILIRQVEKEKKKELYSVGNQIVSLISLHSIHDFEGKKRDFFIKSLMEHTSPQNLAYCFVDDKNGKPVIAFSPNLPRSEIPREIQLKSLAAEGLTYQQFRAEGSDDKIYEFTKPIFESGEKTGTVRVALKPPSMAMIFMENISLMAMLSFLVISAITIIYYGFIKALKPLEQFSGRIRSPDDGLTERDLNNGSIGFRISPMLEEFKSSFVEFKERLENIEDNNKALASKVGVLKFEKNQAINTLNSINLGIIIIDVQDNVNNINDYMLKLLHETRSQVIDRPLEEVLRNPKVLSFVSEQQSFERPRPTDHLDTGFPDRAPGETFRVSCSFVRDKDNALIGKIILFQNVTQEKAAETATLEFSAHLSHELRTPLTTIKSYSEMLMDGEVEDNETKIEFYNVINSETARLSRLIKDLLNLSKIEIGSLVLDKGLVKTDWFFEDCLAAVEGAARKKNISIQRHLPDNFPSLIGDKDQLKSAIINILGNAVKYTPANGEIHFGLGEENNRVLFDIRDTGYGIAEEDLPHVFDKFYRAENSQISEQQGTGLGLAITSKIIGLHEGEIDVQSEPGRGTRFTVKIPKEEYYLGKDS